MWGGSGAGCYCTKGEGEAGALKRLRQHWLTCRRARGNLPERVPELVAERKLLHSPLRSAPGGL
jgi:hypothetical protein